MDIHKQAWIFTNTKDLTVNCLLYTVTPMTVASVTISRRREARFPALEAFAGAPSSSSASPRALP